jgi:hypothetical protein
MTTGSHSKSLETEAGYRAALADLIDQRRDAIVARWMQRIGPVLPRPLAATQLRDAMPDYLARLSDALRLEGQLEQQGTTVWEDVARVHALTRVRLGFDIDELVHEFVVLRQVLSDVSREHQAILNVAQAERVADLIDGAIASAVRSYVEARDYEARQREAEHIGFITHELRNPLSAAKLATNRLRRSAPQSDAHLLDILERNVNRLEGLIDGVLTAERLEAGKVEPQVTSLEVAQLLERPLRIARMQAEAKGLTLVADVEPHVRVHADPELAASAISNVIDNALKYTDAGQVRVNAAPAVDHVTIHVWDNCQGLSGEELQTIFEPFHRGHSRKPGTGLGLAIARRALEAQGGSIHAESPGDRGCHFWLTLPRAALDS